MVAPGLRHKGAAVIASRTICLRAVESVLAEDYLYRTALTGVVSFAQTGGRNEKNMLQPGFEPRSSDRKSEMIGRTTPLERVRGED